MNVNSILSYINFARKAGDVLYGIDNIKSSKKYIYCILIDDSATENLQTTVQNFCERFKIPCIKLSAKLDDVLKTKNCKVLGILNQNLAQQIILSDKE